MVFCARCHWSRPIFFGRTKGWERRVGPGCQKRPPIQFLATFAVHSYVVAVLNRFLGCAARAAGGCEQVEKANQGEEEQDQEAAGHQEDPG